MARDDIVISFGCPGVARAGLTNRASYYTLRHSFVTSLLEDSYDICGVQESLGHKSVKTTMLCTDVVNSGRLAVRSPAVDRRRMK